MKKVLFYLFLFFCLLVSAPGIAQVNDDVFKPVEILPNTPDVVGLTKNAHATTSLHTGAISENIPLVTLSAKRLQVPVSLSYSSNGIMVDQISSVVGLGWNLNTGGFISRTVLGQPDEQTTFVAPPADLTDWAAWNNFLEVILSPYADNQPDIFTFSVEGTSGRFIIESQVIRKLDQNNLNIIGDPSSGFVITTSKGVKYMFSDIEEVKTVNNCQTGGGSRQYVANSWLLSRIEHPLGEYISFDYDTKAYSYASSVSETAAKLMDDQVIYVPRKFSYQSCVTTQYNTGKFLTRISSNFGTSLTFQYQNREDITGSLRLDKIIFKERDSLLKTIEFSQSYSIKTSSLYDNNYSGLIEKRLFLDALNIWGNKGEKENYEFNYIERNSLPPRLSYSKDHSGFFNGKRNRSLIPKPKGSSFTASSLDIPDFADRTPNSAFAKIGLLNKIKFPSGGVDSILYEPHIQKNEERCNLPSDYTISGESTFKQLETFEYTFSVTCAQTALLHFACTAIGDVDYDEQYYSTGVDIYDANNNNVYSGAVWKNQVADASVGLTNGVYRLVLSVRGPNWGNCDLRYFGINNDPASANTEVGGLRVKEILKIDGNAIKEIIAYDYTNNGIESPVLANPNPYFNMPFLRVTDYQVLGVVYGYYEEYNSFSFFDFPQYSGVSVGYDNVVEKFGRNAENGSVTHRFSNFIDKIADVYKGYLIPGAPLGYSGRKSGEEFYTSFKNNEGKKVKEIWKYYSNKPELDYRKEYYIARNRSSRVFKSSTFPPVIVAVDINKFELNTSWNKLDSVITNTYSEKNGQTSTLIEKELYDYDNLSHLLVTKQQKISSDGQKLIMNVTYPEDYASGELSLDSMKIKHMRDFPVEQVRYTEKDGVKRVVSGNLINYSSDGTGKIGSIMNLEIATPQLLSSFKFSNQNLGILPFQGPPTGFQPSDLYKENVAYLKYDYRGNPLEVSIANGPSTSYIWGYDGQHLLAEVKNATAVESEIALGGSSVINQLNAISVSNGFIQQSMQSLRLGLPRGQVGSYLYVPQVGIVSFTDPKGLISYYEYDGFQRLKHVKDQDGNIIKSYDYHYKP
uniref:hypothetical protein n=1 Tax=Pedobacter schmidteae TaxID=2201271 RepID=UPI000EB409B2|nr:hypothetical protein [Pedobacter schmidteae]